MPIPSQQSVQRDSARSASAPTTLRRRNPQQGRVRTSSGVARAHADNSYAALEHSQTSQQQVWSAPRHASEEPSGVQQDRYPLPGRKPTLVEDDNVLLQLETAVGCFSKHPAEATMWDGFLPVGTG